MPTAKKTNDGFTVKFTGAEMRRLGAKSSKVAVLRFHPDLSIKSLTPFWDGFSNEMTTADVSAIDKAFDSAESMLQSKYVIPEFKRNPKGRTVKKKPTAAQLAARKLFAQRAKAGAFKRNPAKRKATKKPASKPVSRASQSTGKKPTARLVERRKRTAKAPRGFFANPSPMPANVGEWRVSYAKNGRFIAIFNTKAEALEYANALANKSGKQIKIERV